MQRWLIGLSVGLSVSFLLYIIMASLIKRDFDEPRDKKEYKMIEIVLTEEDDTLETRIRRAPKKKPPPKNPPPPQLQKVVQVNKPVLKRLDLKIQRPTVNTLGDVIVGPTGTPSGDGNAIPQLTMQPTYPEEALRKGIAGSVTFKFTVSADGTPKDIQVVKATDRIFTRAARRSIRRWRFKPKIVDGKAVDQPNMTYTLQFKLPGADK